MPQISSSEDVYRHLVEESDENWIYGLVAFAIIEEQRIEWMQHFNEHNNRAPNTVEIQHWYEQQPGRILFRAKGDAEGALTLYSALAVDQAIEDKREEILLDTVISEVRLTRRPWQQFGINVAAGFASAVLFAALLIVLAAVVLTDVSPVDLWRAESSNQTKERQNGETYGEQRSNQ